LVTVNDLTEDNVNIGDTLLIAGGGGGGGAGRGKAVCSGHFGILERIDGENGGSGASVFASGAPTTIGAGINGGSNSGQGGQVDRGGARDGGTSTAGDDPTAPLGGRGGNHFTPQIGFDNASGVQVTGSGGRGSDGGILAGGGGGAGGYTGGGGGNRGTTSTGCTSGGGGGGSSFTRLVPDSPTCSAAPTSRPDNPNGSVGFVQITFDLGACE
jgi:hypothetical protein